MTCRPARPDETAATAELFALCFGEVDAWSEDGILTTCRERAGRLVVLEEAGQLLGAILLSTQSGEAEVLQVAVAPDRRGLGLGRRLLRAGEAAAIEAGASRVFLEVRADNSVARRLYESEGYREVGRRPGYYRDGVAALQLVRELAPGPPPVSC